MRWNWRWVSLSHTCSSSACNFLHIMLICSDRYVCIPNRACNVCDICDTSHIKAAWNQSSKAKFMVVTLCYIVTIPWTLAYSQAGLIAQHIVYKALPLRASLEESHFCRPMFCLFEKRTSIQQLHKSVYIGPHVHVHYMTLIYLILSSVYLYTACLRWLIAGRTACAHHSEHCCHWFYYTKRFY